MWDGLCCCQGLGPVSHSLFVFFKYAVILSEVNQGKAMLWYFISIYLSYTTTLQILHNL